VNSTSVLLLPRSIESAGLRRWPLQLTWQGFEVEAGVTPNGEQLAELEQTLLLRFV
jgi:hypothetical protein